MNPDIKKLIKRLREYAWIDYGTEAYPLSAAEANKLVGIAEALEYYAHPDHYTESPTLNKPGVRPPGVLTDKGAKARRALK